MEKIKRSFRKVVRSFGYEIKHCSAEQTGFNKFADLKRLLGSTPAPVLFDVGANVGQTVKDFKDLFPDSVVHSFEPSPTIFERLQQAASEFSGVHPNNMALGNCNENRTLKENSSSVMSSFLEPDADCWGQIIKETPVRMARLDDYCAAKEIRRIDLLKIDTQGFDIEVLQGATEIFGKNAVHMVLIELTFSRQYKGGAAFEDVCAHLRKAGFRLVTFYSIQYRSSLADWCDALFVNPAFSAAGTSLRP